MIRQSSDPDYFEAFKNLSFDDCELAILKHNVDIIEKRQGKEQVDSEDVCTIINIVEEYFID